LGRLAPGYADGVSEARGERTGSVPHPLRRYRIRRLNRRVESLRAELERSENADPVTRLELLYRLADETEKLDRLGPDRPPG